MKELLRKTIDILKKRVQYNLKIINNNEKNVKDILKEPVSSDRSERLDEKFGINKKILEENNDSLKIQLSIIKFLEKYSKQLDEFAEILDQIDEKIEEHKTETKEKEENSIQDENTDDIENYEIKEVTRDDYFELTINESIEYDDQHPYFNDKDFFEKLMGYFTDIEDYEMCTKLIASHKKDDAFLN